MSEQALRKLVSVFARQQLILKKLSQLTDEEIQDEYSRDTIPPEMPEVYETEMQGNEHLDNTVQEDPALLERALKHHKAKKVKYPEDYEGESPSVMNQLHHLSEGNPYMWGTLGQYYKGMTPRQIGELIQRLKQ